MCFEPTLFASPMFETANEAFLFCKDYLEKSDASRLEGLEPINTPAMGRIALTVLTDVHATVRGEAKEHVRVAINAMRRALQEPAYSAVA